MTGQAACALKLRGFVQSLAPAGLKVTLAAAGARPRVGLPGPEGGLIASPDRTPIP